MKTTLEKAVQRQRTINRRARRAGNPGVPIYPLGIEREYQKLLTSYVDATWKIIRERFIPELSPVKKEQEKYRPDSAGGDIDYLLGLIRTEVASKIINKASAKKLAQEVGDRVSAHNRRQIEAMMLRSVGVKPRLFEPYLGQEIDTFAFLNSQLIVTLPEKLLQRVETISITGVSKGESVAKITRELRNQVGIEKKHARLIARDQVGKLNGQMNELRQKEIGVSKYKWMTAGDGAVRDAHIELDGNTYSWDDPPVTDQYGNRNHPGEDFQCRCTALPIIDAIENLKLES